MSSVKNAAKKLADILKNNKLSIALYLLMAVLLVAVLSAKINVNLDEIYSYGLANYTKGLNLVVQENVKHEPAAAPYMEYVTATDRFNYRNVWQNQANDVHPPLYYAIVHTVCSLFPGSFSIWYAGIINIFFSLATLLFVQLIAWELTGNNKWATLVVSSAFALCGGVLYANAFLRMYIMAMCQVTCITWLVVRQTGENKLRFFFPLLMVTAAAGALIHYYCIVYTVVICGVYFIYLLVSKKYKQAGLLVGTGLCAGAAAIAVFPHMIMHIFFSYRGEESFSNIGGAEKAERLSDFYGILSRNLFGNAMTAVLIAASVLAVVAAVKKTKGEAGTAVRRWQYAMVFVPAAVYFVIISTVAVYITNRYITPIYAVLLCGVFSLVSLLLVQLVGKNKGVVCTAVLVAVITVMTFNSCQRGYLYSDTQPLLDFAKQHSDTECLYLFDGVRFRMMPSFVQVSEYKNVNFINYKNEGFLWSCDYSGNDELVLIVVGADENAIEQVLGEYPQFTACDEIGNFGYATTYHLHG